MRLAFVAFILVLLAGCMVRPPQVPIPADRPWRAFTAQMMAVEEIPGFSARMSITTISGDGGHRMTAEFWGTPTLPLRLDLQAGIGRTVSMIREDGLNLQAYVPDSNRVYHHPDSKTGITLLGLDTPFSLAELAGIIAGDWARIIPADFSRALSAEAGTRRYEFDTDPRIAAVVLDDTGRVLQVAGRKGWTLLLEQFPDPPARRPVAGRLTVTGGNGDRLVIRIKSFSLRSEPWPENALDLEVPENAVYMLLQDHQHLQ